MLTLSLLVSIAYLELGTAQPQIVHLFIENINMDDVDPVARIKSFRVLKIKTLMEYFLTLKLSGLESLRALKLS
jgi:hypothetical protein